MTSSRVMADAAPYGKTELLALVGQVCDAKSSVQLLENQRKAHAATAEAALWDRFRGQQDMEAREALILLHLPYARAVAAGVYGQHTYHETDFAEYVQLATMGLIDAVDRYDPGRGAQFRTYAHLRMRGAILNGLDHISERQEQIGLHRRLQNERVAAAKALVDVDLLTADEDLLVSAMAEISASIMLGFMLDGTGMFQTPDSALPDGCYDAVVFKQETQRLHNLLDQLTPREQSVIRLHYLQGMPFESVATKLGITRGRVSQLHEQGLRRLRGLLIGQ